MKRASSWYGSEVDVQVKNSGYEEEVMQKDGNELHHMGDKTLHSSLVVKDFQPTRSALKSCSNSEVNIQAHELQLQTVSSGENFCES